MITNSSKIIEVQVQQTVSIELTEADIVALKVMLYRMPGENELPILKVSAIKYIKARFDLGLKPAKEVVDYICSNQWLLN